jgi:hypothetical protein
MKTSLIFFTILAVLVLTSAPVSANPATLPKHPGYPMDRAVDPVMGKSLANDPGQSNATGNKALVEAAGFDNTHVMQSLSPNPNEKEVMENSGASAPQTNQERSMKK